MEMEIETKIEMEMVATIIFLFFLFSVSGWILETIHESITRRKFINKGFFKGPYVPIQGVGGLAVYAVCSQFRPYPILVFFAGAVLCTVVEYITAIFLEKCFAVKCWDYETYPHTKWCHYKGRVSLTISLFFGITSLFVVYVYWNIGVAMIRLIGRYIWLVDAVLLIVFFADIIFTCTKYFYYKKSPPQSGGDFFL
jgi:uncharacterized membrane protein